MPVPEAAMHENRLAVPRKHDVGAAGQFTHIQSVPETHPVDHAPHLQFGRSIPRLHAPHPNASFILGQCVCHGPRRFLGTDYHYRGCEREHSATRRVRPGDGEFRGGARAGRQHPIPLSASADKPTCQNQWRASLCRKAAMIGPGPRGSGAGKGTQNPSPACLQTTRFWLQNARCHAPNHAHFRHPAIGRKACLRRRRRPACPRCRSGGASRRGSGGRGPACRPCWRGCCR